MRKKLSIKQLTELVMRQAAEKGFGTSPKEINVPEKIALIHAEISEAYEAYRKKKFKGKDSLGEELGDAVQRILHLSGVLGIDIEKEILKKIKINRRRKWDWRKMNEKHCDK